MLRFSLAKWLRNISIARKLYFTVGLMAMLIAVELGTLMFSIKTLSSVRAYVSAEGLWSKAQKNAAYSLQKYGRSRNEEDYNDYLLNLTVPLGDHKTRLELAKPQPDLSKARQGFLEGRVHPDDIDGAIKLFRRFHKIYYINKAIETWTMGDELLSQMMFIGDDLHKAIRANAPAAEVESILSELDDVNLKLTVVEDEFSFTLGEGSRWLTNLVLKLLLALVLTVEISGLSITILVSRGISVGLNSIIHSAEKIAEGDYSSRAKVFSRDEIGVLANAFNDMTGKLQENIAAITSAEEKQKASKEIAEKSLAVKEHFLANMSHEIRTPMNAVIGFTRLLEDTPLNKEQQEIIRSIKISSQSLMTIINDILDYSRLESGKIRLEHTPFSVRKIFESLHVMLQQRAREKKLALEFSFDESIPGLVAGDPTRLMQALINLGDNAVKFTDSGRIDVSVTKAAETEHNISLEFRVKDTGRGIPADKLNEIFERFTQVSAETTRKYGGTGLGLTIVKGLVELQNGTLSVKSEPDRGSEFSFTITYDKTAEAPRPEPQPQHIAEPRKRSVDEPLRILVVEDNPVNQMLVIHVLKKYGLVSEIAENGEVGVEKMRTGHFDLILMDIQMPIMDGYEATQIIRKELNSNIPIVALTAHAMDREKEKCLSMGMNEFITKPFEQKQLYDTIIKLCNA